jgi:hypothetical protein
MTSFGIPRTYPPIRCGQATFSAALLRHLTGQDSSDRAGVLCAEPCTSDGVELRGAAGTSDGRLIIQCQELLTALPGPQFAERSALTRGQRGIDEG